MTHRAFSGILVNSPGRISFYAYLGIDLFTFLI